MTKLYTANELIIKIIRDDLHIKGTIGISHPIGPDIYTVRILGKGKEVYIPQETLFNFTQAVKVLQKLKGERNEI